MPYILNTMSPGSLTATTDLQYKYPNNLDLRPGSVPHQKILTMIYSTARESFNEISKRHTNWKKIDRTLTAFVPSDDDETKVKAADDRKPVAIVVPFSFATLETLLTYMTAAFLEMPIFRYVGVSPEDIIGGILLEKIIEMQCYRAKIPLALHTMFRDSFAYGFGAATPTWDVVHGRKTVKEPGGWMSAIFGRWMDSGSMVRKSVPTVLYEGNYVENIDPYCYLPDPNVPIYQPQKGEFVGWVKPSNYMKLLEQEKNSQGGMFNVRYLAGETSAKSQFNADTSSGRYERFGGGTPVAGTETAAIDTVYIYKKIIPKNLGLGSSEYPEKWLFAMAADKVVVMARPLNLDHDMFPNVVCSPDYDGHSLSPISKLEMVYGLQETLDWMFQSHITNVRKAINDMLIVDPSIINIQDLRQPGPGRLVRLRRAAWGKGADKAVQQLNVVDVTKQHIQDASYIVDLIKQCSGSLDSVMGIQRKTSERVSATESRDLRMSALNRLAKDAKIISYQAMQDLGYMLASHVIQLMTKQLYVDMSGTWQEQLMAEYGADSQRVKVTPFDLVVDYDVVVKDGSVTSSENGDLWIQLYQMSVQNPVIANQFDTVRIFKHIARLLGAKDVNEFVRKGVPPVQTKVMPDEQVEAQVQKGNLIPMPTGGEA